MLEFDLSQAIPDPEWNIYGATYSKRSPRLACLQIQWDGLTGTLDGTLELEVSNMVTRGDGEEDEFVTQVPLKKDNGDPLVLDSASNKDNCKMVLIEAPHASWRLKVNKGGITSGIIKALMIEPSE